MTLSGNCATSNYGRHRDCHLLFRGMNSAPWEPPFDKPPPWNTPPTPCPCECHLFFEPEFDTPTGWRGSYPGTPEKVTEDAKK